MKGCTPGPTAAAPTIPHATEAKPLDRSAARGAAQWLALLYSGAASPDDLAACARWRAEHPEHERAWQCAERLRERLGQLPPAAAGALSRERHNRRALIRTLTLLLVAAPAGYLAWQHRATGLAGLGADLRTATGEHQRLPLPDGGELHLNTATAANLVFDSALRRIVLRGGEILVTTGANDPRPFVVDTAFGRLRALGTRFIVRQLPGEAHAWIGVLEGAVELRPQHGDATPQVVTAGQQARLHSTRAAAPAPLAEQADSWTRGLLSARAMPLGDFAAQLDRHRPGRLRCDPAVAHLRISGLFRLNDSENIIAALPQTLPVSVVYRTRWWITLAPPGE